MEGAGGMDCREAWNVFNREIEEVIIDQGLRFAAYQHIWSCPGNKDGPCPARVLVEETWSTQGQTLTCAKAQAVVADSEWPKIGTTQQEQEQERWQAFCHFSICSEEVCGQIWREILVAAGEW